MDYKNFFEKLSGFFTIAQIWKLNEMAANDFEDHSAGRENVCILIYDIVGLKDFFGEDDVIMRLESIAGGTISRETVENLEEQMIREW